MEKKQEAEAADIAATNAPVRIYRKKELVGAVAAASGVKKKTVRPVVDALLAELGAVLLRGDALNLPPLGKVAVHRTREGAKSDVMMVRIRRFKPGTAEGEAAAEASEAGVTEAGSEE